MELISIIIPLYNKADTINRAISSILNQETFHRYSPEIIIVNDGSTDGSLFAIDNSFLSLVKCYSIPNSGVSFARNFGFQKSIGKIIYFLDGDDELLPGALDMIYLLINNFPNCDFYSGSIELVNEKGDTKKIIFKESKILSDNFFLNFLINPLLITSSSSFFKRSFFEKSEGFPNSFVRGEDIYLWLTMAINGKFATINQPISRIYRNADNRSANVNIANFQLPYFITYFIEDKDGKKLLKGNIYLRVLVYWLGIKNMLGFKELGIKTLVNKTIKVMYDFSFLAGFLFYIFSILPLGIITRIRSFRN